MSERRTKIITMLLSLVFLGLIAFAVRNCAIQQQVDRANEIVDKMSLEEKVGQLFLIRPEALSTQFTTAEIENVADEAGVKVASDDMINNMKSHHLGGIALFAKNIATPNQTTELIDKFQNNSDIKLFMGIDEEGGEVARIANNPTFGVNNVEGGMKSIGVTGDPGKAYEASAYIGDYLTKYKLNLDFAPVCDVLPNNDAPNNKGRIFGSDPKLVGDMAQNYIRGLHDKNIMSTMKHFPGDGSSKGDTHKNTVVVDKTWEELKSFDIIPFERAIEADTDFAMIGHIEYPRVTGNDYPASLSREIITDKLKGELGFKGIVITDALAMEAVNSLYTSDVACITALNAGVDILLMPKDFELAYQGVIKAVNDGRISQDSINEHVKRIINVKLKHGLAK
ncbi:MAG: glycoside hydrolase family 3 N-terminal domain-containing protein [Coriobacteriia bacterium]|nr:glycoside hydrolase family 3 N-terminal domain-containing protein [Coriobacteriia bacterium]